MCVCVGGCLGRSTGARVTLSYTLSGFLSFPFDVTIVARHVAFFGQNESCESLYPREHVVPPHNEFQVRHIESVYTYMYFIFWIRPGMMVRTLGFLAFLVFLSIQQSFHIDSGREGKKVQLTIR